MLAIGLMYEKYIVASPEPPPVIMRLTFGLAPEVAVTPTGHLSRVIKVARMSNQEQVRIIIPSEGVPQREKVAMQGHNY